jgi:hypothetical protein
MAIDPFAFDTVSVIGYESGGSGYAHIDNVAVGGTVVPEPATLGFLALGGLALLRRRR